MPDPEPPPLTDRDLAEIEARNRNWCAADRSQLISTAADVPRLVRDVRRLSGMLAFCWLALDELARTLREQSQQPLGASAVRLLHLAAAAEQLLQAQGAPGHRPKGGPHEPR